MFSVACCCLHPSRLCLLLVSNCVYGQYARVCRRLCVCVYVCVCVYALRIVSTDQILRFMNTLIN